MIILPWYTIIVQYNILIVRLETHRIPKKSNLSNHSSLYDDCIIDSKPTKKHHQSNGTIYDLKIGISWNIWDEPWDVISISWYQRYLTI